MQRRHLLSLAVVAMLLLVPGMAVATVQDHKVTGHPGLDVSLADNTVTPGQETALELQLLNDGNVTNGSLASPSLEQQVTTARAVRVQVNDSDAPITVHTNERAIARLPDGGSAPLPFRIAVDENAAPGTYQVPVYVEYNYTESVNTRTGEKNTTTASKTITVTLEVEDRAAFEVVSVDSKARVGSTGTVSITFRNVGSEAARNTSVGLTSRSSALVFGQSPSTSRFVDGRWEPGETRTVDYRLTATPSASTQTYTFDSTLTFENENGNARQSDPLTFGIEPDPQQDFTIVSTDSSLAVGESGTVTVTVRNDGPVTVRDASVTLTSQNADIVFGQSATASSHVGEWAPGETRTIEIEATALPGAEQRNYAMQATVSYEDGEGDPGAVQGLSFGVTPAPEQTFEIVSTDSKLPVGANGPINVTIRNTGPRTITDASVTLTSQNSDLVFGQSATASSHVGEWAPGETRTIQVEATALPGAEQRNYAMQAQVSYETASGDAGASDALSFGVEPMPERSFEIVGVDSGVAIGDTGTVNVTIRNTGPTAVRDASVTLTSQNGKILFGQQATATQYVGQWAAGETRTIQVDASALSSAEQRNYAIQAQVSYEDGDGDPGASDALSFGLVPDPEQSFDVSGVSSTLRVGEEGTIEGTITNTGDATVENVVVVFRTQNQNVDVFEREYAIGSLDPGESATFEFDAEVSSSADAGPRQFSFVAEYKNSDGKARTSDTFDETVTVGEKRDAFAVSVDNASVSRGATTLLEITVTNNGNETYSDVSAKLFADSPLDVEDSDAFVSELKPGGSETLTFEISASGSAITKTYPVQLDFQYDTPDGDTLLSDTYRTPVSVTQSETSDDGGSGPPPLLVALVVVIVLAAAGGVYARYYR